MSETERSKRGTRAVLPLLLAVGAIALLLWGLSQREDAPAGTPSGQVLPIGGDVQSPSTSVLALREFLSADDRQPPRTFILDRPIFEPRSARIRTEDRQTVALLTEVLQHKPRTRVRIIGHDVAGEPPQLGKQRADALAAELRKNGVGAEQLETASGGVADLPRTELIVLKK